jgi:hypothetical protein
MVYKIIRDDQQTDRQQTDRQQTDRQTTHRQTAIFEMTPFHTGHSYFFVFGREKMKRVKFIYLRACYASLLHSLALLPGGSQWEK